MFAKITPLLTLIAFAVHAVLGCCWHHSHPLGNACCVEHVESIASAKHCVDADLGHRHTAAVRCNHAGHSHSHSHANSHAHAAPDASQNPVTAELAASDVAEVALTDADSPCGHSHQCDEAHCHFVGMFSKWIDFELQAASVPLVFSTVGVLPPKPLDTAFGELHRSCPDQILSASEHCVRLQSWQI
ncbi:hypothetical protein [Novipirellula caenicola]|uniref:hypothetical protein n=1 Tax=Novipirellula caenicola TaxID=1536901 RepID=UPI0031ED14B4